MAKIKKYIFNVECQSEKERDEIRRLIKFIKLQREKSSFSSTILIRALTLLKQIEGKN